MCARSSVAAGARAAGLTSQRSPQRLERRLAVALLDELPPHPSGVALNRAVAADIHPGAHPRRPGQLDASDHLLDRLELAKHLAVDRPGVGIVRQLAGAQL